MSEEMIIEMELKQRNQLFSFLEDKLWELFRQYDMSQETDVRRINNIFDFCVRDICKNPTLIPVLAEDKKAAEF
jgi:hypothetical protein